MYMHLNWNDAKCVQVRGCCIVKESFKWVVVVSTIDRVRVVSLFLNSTYEYGIDLSVSLKVCMREKSLDM